jgi:hypothetical protein
LRKTSRDECINRLQSGKFLFKILKDSNNNQHLKSFPEIEADTLSNLVDQRLDLEISMGNVLHLEQKLRNLTSSGPDFTEGRLTPVSVKTLEVRSNCLRLYCQEFH